MADPNSDGPISLGDILARALAERSEEGSAAATAAVPTPSETVVARSNDPEWLVHETELLRRPVYRTERADSDEPAGSYFDGPNPAQLPLLRYEYDDETELLTRIGELNSRDMLVMASIQQAFYEADCPVDGKIHGDRATLGNIARQIGMHPEGATALIRSSIERLATAKVRLRLSDKSGLRDAVPVNTKGEVVFGFVAGYGWREQSRRGVVTDRTNYIQLDPMLGELIRRGHFTFLRADVLRQLRRRPLALKLYAWARTHKPSERGTLLPYGISTLVERLGCGDTNSTRRRRKLIEALDAVCAAAPDEFPGYTLRPGRREQVVTIRRNLPRPRLQTRTA